MAKISKDLGAGGTLHPRENLFISGTLGSLNAGVIVDSDACSSFSLDLRGTFSLTVEVSGTVDGTNWTIIPVRPINVASITYLAAITGTAAGIWFGECAGFNKIRARVTAYTSGAATATLAASVGCLTPQLQQTVTTGLVTVTAASGAIATLTIPSPGAGLRNYITYMSVNRYAAAVLTASATPVLVTTTNIPGTLVFTFPADAAALGTLFPWREDFAYPLASTAQATATTIVAPATTGVIWRITAGFYVAP